MDRTNIVKPIPINPPMIHPFDLPLTPATRPPKNKEINLMVNVIHDKGGSLSEVNRRKSAKMILVMMIKPNTTIQPYNNAIDCLFFIMNMLLSAVSFLY